MNLLFLSIGEFNVLRFFFTQVLVTCIVGTTTRYFLDTWRSLQLEQRGSIVVGRSLPIWKTSHFSTSMGISGIMAVIGALVLFSIEGWIELSSGAGEAIEFENRAGFEYVKGSCEYLNTSIVYGPDAPNLKAFCMKDEREGWEDINIEDAMRQEGRLLRDFVAKIYSSGCCPGQAESSRYFWTGEPEELSVFCEAGCRARVSAAEVGVPTERQCQDITIPNISCSIDKDPTSLRSTLVLNIPKEMLKQDPDDSAHSYMRLSLALGVFQLDFDSALKLTCMRTLWGKEMFEARCIVTTPDGTRWLAWATEQGEGGENQATYVKVESSLHLKEAVKEQDYPIFLLARDLAPSHNALEAASIAAIGYQTLKLATRKLDLVQVLQTPSAVKVVPFVALTPWVSYFVLITLYGVACAFSLIISRRRGIVTNRIDDAARAYARWASEKMGACRCANGIDEPTYVVIKNFGEACHLTVDTKPSGVPLLHRPLLGKNLRNDHLTTVRCDSSGCDSCPT